MKKFLFTTLIMASAISFISCDRDEPATANLSPSTVSLYVGDSTLLTYSGGFNTGSNQWKSENELIASVNFGSSTGYNGMVKAHKVGTTTIWANEWISSSITVLPRYTMFTEPSLEWGTSKASIEKMMSNYELTTSNDSTLGYKGNENVLGYLYSFNNQKLEFSIMIIDLNTCDPEDLAKFLNERYYIDYIETEGRWVFVSPDKKTGGIMQPYEKDPTFMFVIYVPLSSSISTTSNINENASKVLKSLDIKCPIL